MNWFSFVNLLLKYTQLIFNHYIIQVSYSRDYQKQKIIYHSDGNLAIEFSPNNILDIDQAWDWQENEFI